MSVTTNCPNISKLPVNSAQHIFDGWNISFKLSHILHSQCSKNGKCAEQENQCEFCLYSSILELPHLPDMVFPSNILKLTHVNGGQITFVPLDALKEVSNGKLALTIACAEAWKESRKESNAMGEEVKSFDWTFSTDYKGTITDNIIVEITKEKIDLEKLRKREEILFYQDITLFEDELHDNGIACMTVKIRVMPSSFFVLLRYFLRVDNVLIKINDTRMFYEKGSNYILREFTSRESKVEDLRVPQTMFTEPSEIAPHLKLTLEVCEKLILPSACI